MSNLEDLIEAKRNVAEAEEVLAENLSLTNEEKRVLKENPLEVMLTKEDDVVASYNLGEERREEDKPLNVIKLSKDAIYNALAVGEEVAHSIRLRLNRAARDYLLNPLNRTKEKAVEYIKKVNLEEYFARLGALVYANYKGQRRYNSLWSTIKDSAIYLVKMPIEFITHYFGYKKAEKEFKEQGPRAFRRNTIYMNDPDQKEFKDLGRIAA